MLGAEQKKISNLYDIKKANIMGGGLVYHINPLLKDIYSHTTEVKFL